MQNDELHQYSGLNIQLPAGNYYLSVYASGAGTDGVDSKLAWLLGANLQPADLEWNGVWRSYSLPVPGVFRFEPCQHQQHDKQRGRHNSTRFGHDRSLESLERIVCALTARPNTRPWFGLAQGQRLLVELGELGRGDTCRGERARVRTVGQRGSATNANNLAAGTLFQGITFLPAAPAYQLSGNSLALGGNVINLSGSNQTIGLALSLAVSGISFDTATAGLGVSGAISGTGGIMKLGSGTLTLTGNASYTGATNIADGTLAFETRGPTVSFASAISGSGSLLKAGSGELVLSGLKYLHGRNQRP